MKIICHRPAGLDHWRLSSPNHLSQMRIRDPESKVTCPRSHSSQVEELGIGSQSCLAKTVLLYSAKFCKPAAATSPGRQRSDKWENQTLAAKKGSHNHCISPAGEVAAEMRCKETKSGGESCRVGRTSNLEPGDLDSSPSSATDNLRYLGQVKLQIWALFSYLYNERAGQNYLESALTPISSHQSWIIASARLTGYVASKHHFTSLCLYSLT